MQQFVGFVTLEETLVSTLLVLSGSETPINADALPTYRIYGPSNNVIANGSCTFRDSGSVSTASNATPIVITSAAHGLTTGARVTITGVTGNSAANTTAVATKLTADTFSIPPAGTGAGTGGTWNVTGLYKASIAATGANGFDQGECYQVNFVYAVSSVNKGQTHSFNVS